MQVFRNFESKLDSLRYKPIVWNGPPITTISLGCEKISHLSKLAVKSIRQAEVIFGSKHHFHQMKHILTEAEKHLFPSPFCYLSRMLSNQRYRRVVILASGDALFYGIGSWLNRVVGNKNLVFFPNISSVQSCFHHIGIPWQDATIISLHGRPISTLNCYLENKRLLGVFTDQQSTPIAIAKILVETGFSESKFWVCEAMGSDQQKVEQYDISDLARSNQEFHKLSIGILLLQGYNRSLTSFPGIPDDCFLTGSKSGYGMISKREIRLTILSLMQPNNGEIVWDIGAGCGSVSIEWARWNLQGQIYAVEKNAARMNYLMLNNKKFGTHRNLTPISGTAPDCCQQLPDPDTVFIGGSGGNLESLIKYAWERINTGGKLVASAVTDKSESVLKQFLSKQQHDGRECEWIQIQINKMPSDSRRIRTLNPVSLLKVGK